jgi:hypothetical protein
LPTDLGVPGGARDRSALVYLRTSQHHAPDPTAWVAAADVVIAGEAVPSGAAAPLVTVSITPVGHGGPDDGLELTEPVLQARSGSLSNHGHMGRPPLTVGGNLGEYVTGVRGAGAASAVARAPRCRDRRRVDARSDADDVRDDTDRHGPLPGGRMVSALGDDRQQPTTGARRHHDRRRRAMVDVVRPLGRRSQKRRRADHDDGSGPAPAK